ncbi:efflux transporter outer membrane subunit [Sphingomonas paeninsulae]|uniref:Efflux transporter outer membrane subunit n=2 Tax=Sphingomonas paeninsulae TaxID=2319844 RepID=A0A494TF43_SPHPE|nr:efflux transporter outer membrane subunit [Sphingomonas paeninsulae]AYJ85623.1 efflux transporter outer membrane subunit [Sphingomonas paeninsulae]
MRAFIGLVCATALTGCSFEPKYIRPAHAVPLSWPAGDAYLRNSEATLPSVTYKDLFRDPKLQAIIGRALVDNQDIAIALANVASARSQYRVQRAALLPGIDASAGVTTGDSGSSSTNINNGTGTTVSGGSSRRTSYTAQVGISAFEVDLFGRVRNLTKASLQEYLATEAGVRAARLTLVSEIASTYLTLATDRSLLGIANDTQVSASKSVDLTRARLKGGIAPRTDLRQAETILDQARSDAANLTTVVAQDRNALELLVGGPVADAELPSSIESIDTLLGELPAGLGSQILLRRPDVVEAEYRLRANNARIGAARANFFPTISLTALAGFASTALSSLFTGNAFAWSVAPSASLPLFDGGANRGNLAFANAQRDLTVAQYKQTVQTAFREVADALARRGTIDRQTQAQIDLETAARDSDFLAEARYKEGIDTFLNRLDSQRTLYTARRALASARLLRADNLVTLYRVLGGDMLIDGEPAPSLPAGTVKAKG